MTSQSVLNLTVGTLVIAGSLVEALTKGDLCINRLFRNHAFRFIWHDFSLQSSQIHQRRLQDVGKAEKDAHLTKTPSFSL